MPAKKTKTRKALVTNTKTKAIKKTTPKKYKQLEKEYNQTQEKFDELLLQKDDLEKIIKSKTKVLPAEEEGAEQIIKKLTSAEIKKYRKELAECKLSIKVTKKELKTVSVTFSKASIKNSWAARTKVKRLNEKEILRREIEKHSEEYKENVLNQVLKLKKQRDHRYDMLEELAYINGAQFNNLLHKVVKEKQPELYKALNISSKVKTLCYRNVREYFGWDFETKHIKGN